MRHSRFSALSSVKKLLKNDRLTHASGNGEISMRLLEEMRTHQEGWIGRVLQALLNAFAQPASSFAAAEHLEEAAALLIAWASDVRHEAEKANSIPMTGSEILVRLPNHFPTFEAIVEGEDRAYVPLLDKTFPITDILVLPRPSPSKRREPSVGSKQNSVWHQSLEKHIHRLHDLRFGFKS